MSCDESETESDDSFIDDSFIDDSSELIIISSSDEDTREDTQIVIESSSERNSDIEIVEIHRKKD